jgi:hypothetical protein
MGIPAYLVERRSFAEYRVSPLILLIIESTEQHYYIIMQFRSQTEGFGSGISAAMLGSGGGYVEELG